MSVILIFALQITECEPEVLHLELPPTSSV